MKKKNPSDATLGIFVHPTRIEAALISPSGTQYDVVHRLGRQRTPIDELARNSDLSSVVPGLKNSDEADFTIQVGDGAGSSGGNVSEMFLSGEFVGLGVKSPKTAARAAAGLRPALITQQLNEILAECRSLGFENPEVAFCISAPDVSYVELHAAPEQADTSSKKWEIPLKSKTSSKERRHLLNLLTLQHEGEYDAGRVSFVPMTSLRGQRRYLAVVPEPTEPVSTTLLSMADQQRASLPAARLLGTEVSMYTALARKALAPTELENTAIIRINSEDTLILFLSGTQLRHFERLRSLTTYDPPETICSRVLLQQDEQKIGEIHHVLVLSEGRSDQFMDTIRRFYPIAAVEPMQEALAKCAVRFKKGEEELRANTVPAVGIALGLAEGWAEDDTFGAVDLLPKKLRQKTRPRLAFAWHTFAALLLLFAVTSFFTWQFAARQAEIDRSRAELRLLNMPDPTVGSPIALQARVDSLTQVYRQYTRALLVLDSLLIGSDQWSRTLEKTSRATQELSGVWFSSWQPTGTSIRIQGYAQNRERVAQLAYRLNGAVHEASFDYINDVRIHPFTIMVPRPIGVPMVVNYLKEATDGVPGLAAQARPVSAAEGQGNNGQSSEQ